MLQDQAVENEFSLEGEHFDGEYMALLQFDERCCDPSLLELNGLLLFHGFTKRFVLVYMKVDLKIQPRKCAAVCIVELSTYKLRCHLRA